MRSVRSPAASKGVCCDKNKQQYADCQENGELEEHDETAGENSAATIVLATRRQQPLNDGLIGAVRGHGEKSAADNAGPKRVM